jgi:hypothetical protein
VITNALIAVFVDFLGPMINSVLPHLDISSWTAGSTAGATYIGQALGVANDIFPVNTLVTILTLWIVILPVIGAYVVFQWVWSHVPMIAGFGTE